MLLSIILEEIDNEYEYYSVKENMYDYVFQNIKDKKKITFNLIDPNQYKRALSEFVKYGQLIRFPEKYILKWKNLIIKNTALLDVLTELNGHSMYFPFEEFEKYFNESSTYETNQLDLFTGKKSWLTTKGEYDVWLKQKFEESKDKDFLKTDDYYNVVKFLDEVYDWDEYLPTFSNGQPLLSDYGLEPILNLIHDELINEETPEKMLVAINKILDVYHRRSDLAEIFIKGGSNSLSDINLN